MNCQQKGCWCFNSAISSVVFKQIKFVNNLVPVRRNDDIFRSVIIAAWVCQWLSIHESSQSVGVSHEVHTFSRFPWNIGDRGMSSPLFWVFICHFGCFFVDFPITIHLPTSAMDSAPDVELADTGTGSTPNVNSSSYSWPTFTLVNFVEWIKINCKMF